MNSYSIDLRIRVVEAYEQGKGSMQQLAELFDVHWHTVQNWIRRFRKEQTVGPKLYKPGPQPKISDEQLADVQKLVEADNTLSQAELSKEIQRVFEVRVSRATAGRMLKRLIMTRKKNVLGQ